MHENKFLEIENFENVFDMSKIGFNVIPYLAIYEKINNA